ncbi:MAG: NADPH-dependent glutamate synthase [Bacilli bacterium]|nr:NADPH-dependent glutamate synthase [Bacilli bacterium]
MANNRVVMRLLDDKERKTTFSEVSLGYNHEEMLMEASRCLNCKNPLCVSGCPVNVDIPKFISYLKEDKVDLAYLEITKQNNFPGICGRVCPQERQCEGKCVRGIKGDSVAIGRLERYASDNYSNENNKTSGEKNGKKVAVIGSGPAGLSFASTALDLGFEVDIYEALHKSGGVLIYGIPEFRLPKRVVKKEIDSLINKGAKIYNDYVIGRTKSIDDLKKEYDGIFIGSGAGLPRFMGIPGENLNGVMSANEFLTRINLMKASDKKFDTPIKKMNSVVVVGGGNVAMDAARVAKRVGANVTLVYRRGIDEMPARKEEIEHAMEEDITFMPLTNPVKISGENGKMTSVTCQKMVLGDLDESGRRSFIPTDEYVEMACDALIMAIGNYPNPIIKDTTKDLEFTSRGLIVTDEDGKTSEDLIYAGGDIVTGAATVISAMGADKKAAYALYNAIFNK